MKKEKSKEKMHPMLHGHHDTESKKALKEHEGKMMKPEEKKKKPIKKGK